MLCIISFLVIVFNSCKGLQFPPVIGYGGETTTVVCMDTDITSQSKYLWLKNSTVIYSQQSEGKVHDGKYNGTTQEGEIILHVLHTNKADAGQYQCSHNFTDAFGTLSVAYKPEKIAYEVSRVKELQLTVTAFKVYPSDSSISIVTCTSHNSSTTEMISASQSIIPNNEIPVLYDIIWIGTTTRTSLTGEYVCTVNFTLIEPYVTSVNVAFTEVLTLTEKPTNTSTEIPTNTSTAAATTGEPEKDELEGWKIGLIVAVIAVVSIICGVIYIQTRQRRQLIPRSPKQGLLPLPPMKN